LDWDFNVSSISGLTASSFTMTAASGHAGFTLPTISTGTTGTPVHGSYQAASSGNYFDLKFLFAEGSKGGDGPDGGVEFGNGDSITYFISGLNASSFVVATKSDGTAGAYTSAAKIDDANSGTWVAGNGSANTVPDAGSTMLLMSLGFGCLATMKRKFIS
jgi:hypothetical protein